MLEHAYYEERRHGGAAWQDPRGLAALRKFGRGALPFFFGYSDEACRDPIGVDSDASIITLGGAGAGKNTTVGTPGLLQYPGNALVFDCKGELSAVCSANDVRLGKAAYVVNPLERGDSFDPLEVLEPGPMLHSNALMLSEALIPPANGHDGFWADTVREWAWGIKVADVSVSGFTSLPRLFKVVNAIEGAPEKFDVFAQAMMENESEAVRRIAAQIITLRAEGERVFHSLMAELYRHLSFLNDGCLRQSLEHPTFKLGKVLTAREQHATIYLVFDPAMLGVWSPYIRMAFQAAMLAVQRDVGGPRCFFFLDEAGQLANGSWPGLERAFTLGRGMGIRVHAFFQDVGQIRKSMGPTAVQTLFASAEVRQFLSIRDIETAELASKMLGEQTLSYTSSLVAKDALHGMREKSLELIQGRDPIGAYREIQHYKQRAAELDYQSRRLLTPQECMALPPERQLLFISGRNLGPIAAFRRNYFEDPRLSGLWMPHPAFPPDDRVRLPGRFGGRWARVVTEKVPRKYAALPQHAGGTWSFVKGYRP